MYQLEKMPLVWFLLNILKPNARLTTGFEQMDHIY